MKIALIGSAPSSVQLAPYHDPAWKIWSCSPGAYPHLKRCDAHFEIHRWEPGKPWFQPAYIAFMAQVQGPVYMIDPVPEIPNSVAYPKNAMLEQFGPYFQTSSLAWMVCLAVASGATEIGLWGVDMAAREEWQFQRTGLQTLLWYVSKHYGVTVTLPPESDLWVPPVLYGFCEANPHHVKMLVRKAELDHRIAAASQAMESARNEAMFLQGARDDNDYHLATWCQDPKALALAYSGNALRLDQVITEAVQAIRAQQHGEPIASIPDNPPFQVQGLANGAAHP